MNYIIGFTNIIRLAKVVKKSKNTSLPLYD